MVSSLNYGCLVHVSLSLSSGSMCACAHMRSCVCFCYVVCICAYCVWHVCAVVHVLMFVYVCGSNQVFCTLRQTHPNPTSPAAPTLRGYGGNAGRSFRSGGLRGRLPAHNDRMLFWIEQCSEPERGKFYVFMALLC